MTKTTYIAFLRAINVGGRIVKMEKLRALFTELGLENVRTYIQSGNVFFDASEQDRAALTAKIEAHLQHSLGYEVPVMLRTLTELEKTLESQAFEPVEITDDVRLCVAFLSEPLPSSLELPHLSAKGDTEIVEIVESDALLVANRSNGRPGNPGAYLEKTFKVKATLRFWGTSAKILAAAKGE